MRDEVGPIMSKTLVGGRADWFYFGFDGLHGDEIKSPTSHLRMATATDSVTLASPAMALVPFYDDIVAWSRACFFCSSFAR